MRCAILGTHGSYDHIGVKNSAIAFHGLTRIECSTTHDAEARSFEPRRTGNSLVRADVKSIVLDLVGEFVFVAGVRGEVGGQEFAGFLDGVNDALGEVGFFEVAGHLLS